MADYITRADAEQYMREVNGRLDALEREIPLLRRELGDAARAAGVNLRPETVTNATAAATASRVGNVTGRVATATAERTGLDYAALAFGLSEVKREIKAQFSVTDGQMSAKWTGTVQYFVDVLAASDVLFDSVAQEAFKRQAGV